MEIEELFFVGPNGLPVVLRLKDSGQTSQIVKPKLGGTIDVIVGQPRQRIARSVALNIPLYELLDLREGAEQRRMIVTMVGDKLLVHYVWFAAKKDSHFDHFRLQCERCSYCGLDVFHVGKVPCLKKKVRAYHHGDLKAAMITATLQLVRSKGPRGFTLNEASRTAGVSVSAPYNHFKDKEALLIEIVLLGNRTIEANLRVAATMDASPQDRLIAVCLAYIDFARNHPDIFAVMFQSGIDKSPYPEVHESGAKAFHVAVELALEIEPTAEAAEVLAMAIWTTAHGFANLAADGAIARMIGPGETSLAEALARWVLAGRTHR